MSVPIYMRIAEELTSRIHSGEFGIGSSIPSVQELRDLYRVSHVTVLRSFQELSGRGVIVRKPGQGYVVGRGAATLRKLRSFGVLFRNISTLPFDQYYNSIMASIQKEAARNEIALFFSGAAARLVFRGLSKQDELIAEAEAMAGSVEGFLLDEWIPDEVVNEILERTGKPAVVVNRRSASPVPAVFPDFEPALERLYATLFRLGYNRFVSCRTGSTSFALHAQESAFDRMVKRYRLDPAQHIIVPRIHWLSDRETFALLREQLEAGKGMRTVFLGCDDSFGRRNIDFFRAIGKEAAHDYGMVGFFGLDSSRTKPELATLKVDTEGMGIASVHALLGGIEGKPVVPSELCGKVELLFGETI